MSPRMTVLNTWFLEALRSISSLPPTNIYEAKLASIKLGAGNPTE